MSDCRVGGCDRPSCMGCEYEIEDGPTMPDPTPLDNGTASPAPDGVNASRRTPLDEIERLLAAVEGCSGRCRSCPEPTPCAQLDEALSNRTVAALVAVAKAVLGARHNLFRLGALSASEIERALAPFTEGGGE